MPGRPICAAPPTRSIMAARCRSPRASSSTWIDGNRRERTRSTIIAVPASLPAFVDRDVRDPEDYRPRHGSEAPGQGCRHPILDVLLRHQHVWLIVDDIAAARSIEMNRIG